MVLGENANVPDLGRGPGLERRPPQDRAGQPYASQGSSQALSPITQKPWALTFPVKVRESLSPWVSAQEDLACQPEAPQLCCPVSCP